MGRRPTARLPVVRPGDQPWWAGADSEPPPSRGQSGKAASRSPGTRWGVWPHHFLHPRSQQSLTELPKTAMGGSGLSSQGSRDLTVSPFVVLHPHPWFVKETKCPNRVSDGDAVRAVQLCGSLQWLWACWPVREPTEPGVCFVEVTPEPKEPCTVHACVHVHVRACVCEDLVKIQGF